MTVNDRSSSAPNVQSTQYLSFRVGREEYAIDVLRVQEIRGYTGMTKVPNVGRDFAGLLNLRGTVVPVIDLRTRFEAVDCPTDNTCVIVVMQEARRVGLVVDRVSDVLSLPPALVTPPPDLGSRTSTVLTGTACLQDRLILIVDVDNLVDVDLGAPSVPHTFRSESVS